MCVCSVLFVGLFCCSCWVLFGFWGFFVCRAFVCLVLVVVVGWFEAFVLVLV